MMARRQILVALIEDSRLVREGVAALLHRAPNLNLLGCASGGDISRFRGAQPQVVLVCHRLRSRSGLRVVEQVRRDLPDARVIVMDVRPAEEIEEFIRLGVVGFVMKDATLQELLGTIEAGAGGLDVLPLELTHSLFSQGALRRACRAEERGRIHPKGG